MSIRTYHSPWAPLPLEQQAWRQQRSATDQPLVVEIGAGAGMHVIQYAQQHPAHFLIAIERTHNKFARLNNRLAHHPHVNNALAVHANAENWVSENLSEVEVDAYFLLYPNPYPKAAQANKRWVNMPFMMKLLETLKPGGRLTLATNELFYYQEARIGFVEDWGLQLTQDQQLGRDFAPRTHFEKKYLLRGEICYNLVFEKR